MNARYATIRSSQRCEIEKIKASRFLGIAYPIASDGDAEEGLRLLRREFYTARHHCSAYRLGPDGARFRSSDDGEPSGSAGRPILQQIEAHALFDVAVVVVRWFGGTKLGVGGLVRAYGAAAAAVLTQCTRLEVVRKKRVEIAFPYECTAVVQGLLNQIEVTPFASRYGSEVVLVVDLPLDQIETFEIALRERSAARARLRHLVDDSAAPPD